MRSCSAFLCTFALAAFTASWPAMAGGLLPDRENKVFIQGRFSQQEPSFILIFSAQPLLDAQRQLATGLSAAQIGNLIRGADQIHIRISSKRASRPGQFEYSFGTADDASMPWNDGREFDWKEWEKYSPDLWDNLCLLAAPAANTANAQAVVTDVAIYRGGKVLFDSRAKSSFPNKHRIDCSMPDLNLAPRQGRHPVLNLARRMEQFRRLYYELGDNPILNLAYSDLAQTEKRKYARRGANWCSEFSSYIYRSNGIMSPDPDAGDIHWRNLRAFFEKNGRVYPAREVATWTDSKKRETIKPGSFVSILIGDSTHSIIFTGWVSERGPITQYVGISGNNKGMVWPHSPIKLPSPDQLAKLTPQELAEFDQKVYFAVPDSLRGQK
jgi:hypothetical protein